MFREQAVFWLSQVSTERAEGILQWLIDRAMDPKDEELRKKALFWISQAQDPRAAPLLEEMISQWAHPDDRESCQPR